jgi:hypothetical protein
MQRFNKNNGIQIPFTHQPYNMHGEKYLRGQKGQQQRLPAYERHGKMEFLYSTRIDGFCRENSQIV